jgi:trk system potassium uptake protein
MFYYPRKISETKLMTRDVSILTFWMGVIMLIPMLISLAYGEGNWWVYLPMILITSGPSFFFQKVFNKGKKPFSGMTIVTLAVIWITFSIVGAYPFIFVAEMDPLDGYFESVSAISTAGLTNIQGLGTAPHSVIFWRAMLSWFGGFGITVFAFYTLAQSESLSKMVLGEDFGHMRPGFLNSAQEVFKIYSMWTVLGISLLALIGLPLFDSFSMSMNAISTTGMDIRPDGWNYYSANFPDAFPFMVTIMGVLMIAGALSFVIHYRVIKNRKLLNYFRDSETRFFLGILVLGIAAVSLYFLLNGANPGPMGYEALSAGTTGGFEITPYLTAGAGDFIRAILLIMILIGGSSASTAGGLKARRVLLLFKYVYWKVEQQISPRGSVSHFRHEGRTVNNDEISSVAVYAFIYCTAIIAASLFMTAFDYGALDSLFIVTSAQGGCGISPIPGWELQAPVKAVLIATMLFGRLEFIPLFALGLYITKRH